MNFFYISSLLFFILNRALASKFSLLTNSDVSANVGPIWLISSTNQATQILCQSTCDSNSNCIVAVYKEGSCFLYSRNFMEQEIVFSNNSSMFKKQSMYGRNYLSFVCLIRLIYI